MMLEIQSLAWDRHNNLLKEITRMVPPVCNLSGLNNILCNIKLGTNATGKISVILATTELHFKR